MTRSAGAVVREFDAIAAALAQLPPQPLTATERSMLSAIPANARTALDAGCGDGRMSRALAERGLQVMAMDVAPEMIALAQRRGTHGGAVTFVNADIMSAELPANTYDVVVSVNVVHHLPLEIIVPRLAALVAPGGTLVIQDVVTRSGLRYFMINLLALPKWLWPRLRERGKRAVALRARYEEHGRGERYLQPHEVEDALRPWLPGVVVTHHIAWRYTALWRCS